MQANQRSSNMITEFEAQVLADLSILKTQMNGLIGDGEHGRINRIERRLDAHVRQHEQLWQRAKGFAAAFGILFTVVQFILQNWLRK